MKPTRFREVSVPVEVSINLNVERSFKPNNGSDYRFLVYKDGNYGIFPKGTKLTDGDKVGITMLILELRHPESEGE